MFCVKNQILMLHNKTDMTKTWNKLIFFWCTDCKSFSVFPEHKVTFSSFDQIVIDMSVEVHISIEDCSQIFNIHNEKPSESLHYQRTRRNLNRLGMVAAQIPSILFFWCWQTFWTNRKKSSFFFAGLLHFQQSEWCQLHTVKCIARHLQS